MPKFSLPKISRSSLLFSLFLLIFLILLGELVYYYWLKRKPVSVPSELQWIVNEKGERGRKGYERLKQEIKAQAKEHKEKPVLVESCLQVPATDPEIGIYQLNKVEEDTYDYFYEGELVRVEEKDYQGCPFIYLVLKIREEFEIAIPSALLAKTDLGEASTLLYKDHLGERVKIKVRYEQSPDDPSNLKMLEWQPLVFLID